MRDLVYHLLLDSQRALIALTTERDVAPDLTAAKYWRAPTRSDPPRSTATRAEQSCAAERADRSAPVDTTQGQMMAVAEFISTLTVAAAVHHLDFAVELDVPDPDPSGLAVVRETFDALLGRPAPASWDDMTYALKGSDRVPLDERELAGSRHAFHR